MNSASHGSQLREMSPASLRLRMSGNLLSFVSRDIVFDDVGVSCEGRSQIQLLSGTTTTHHFRFRLYLPWFVILRLGHKKRRSWSQTDIIRTARVNSRHERGAGVVVPRGSNLVSSPDIFTSTGTTKSSLRSTFPAIRPAGIRPFDEFHIKGRIASRCIYIVCISEIIIQGGRP